MNDDLLATLRGLRHDPTLAARLYPHLFAASYWAVVQKPGGPVADLRFLTSPTPAGVRELPVFTTPDRGELIRLCAAVPAAMPVEIAGENLWPRVLELVKTGECAVAVDPGEPHTIRVTRDMVLGMVNMFDAPE